MRECKKLIVKCVYNKGFIRNPSNWECECDKPCDIGEYLDYSNCKYRKKLIDKLVEECTKNIVVTRLIETSVKNEQKCSSCTAYRVLFWIFFILFVINVEIGTYFTYYKYLSLNKENVSTYNYTHETTIH